MSDTGSIAVALASLTLAGLSGPLHAQRPARTRATAPSAEATRPQFDSTLFRAMRWRSIGPFRGGRVTAVTGVVGQPYVYYFGATGGGVWKTTDGGMSWSPVADSILGAGSIGAVAVAESDPNVVYVGGGESPLRGNVSPCDGMDRSTYAGRTWSCIGLERAGQIGAIRVHPTNPDLVYAAVLGHAFGPNPERGVFRSRDGGRTWEKVLFRSDSAGAIDVAMDPSNPRVLYAAFWQAVRRPWEMISGGPGSGLFKSSDGGDTWTEITRNPGLPRGVVGKIGVSVSHVNGDRVWALVEAEDGGLFRSDDAGRTWTRTSEDRNLRQRAWYYTHVHADPGNNDGVYVLNVSLMRSGDGGRTFTSIQQPHGDNHALWIDPHDAKRMVNGDDGGASVSYNGGVTWTSLENQPTAQLYHVVTTNDFPYRVCGAQQDNSTICVPSRTSGSGIGRAEWQILGGCESGYIAVRPDTTEISYAGCYGNALERQDRRSGQERNINIWPDNPMGHGAADQRYRFQWTYPIVLSPHDPNTLYAGAQVVFRSTNEGQSWTAISGDLTRNDSTKQGATGGPITKDNTSIEYYDVVFTIAPSSRDQAVIWAGSDDGLVHVTRDGGQSWQNVTPPDLPEWATISIIEASPNDAATAYVAANRYRLDDFAPYVYRTADFGRTWTRITRGIPLNHFIRAVREDPERRGLLYAGGEFGVYVSFDDGAAWQSLRLNLPVVPVHDLRVTGGERVAAADGRWLWVRDDLAPRRQMAESVAAPDLFLYQPRDVIRMGGGPGGPGVGRNPPGGAVVSFTLKAVPDSTAALSLEFLDSAGTLIRSFTTRRARGADSLVVGRIVRDSLKVGMNRVIWNMRYPDAAGFQGLIMWAGGTTGPLAPPGRYQVRLTTGGRSLTREFRYVSDPRVHTSAEDYARQFQLLERIRDRLSEANRAVVKIRELRGQIDQVTARLDSAAGVTGAAGIRARADSLKRRLTAIEDQIYQTKNRSGQDPLNFPIRINNRIAALAGVVAGADVRPTDQAVQVFDQLSSELQAQLDRLRQVVETDVPAFNALVHEANVPALNVRER
jgi:photosystem II stability/assembly factor-like uncharacterized protein